MNFDPDTYLYYTELSFWEENPSILSDDINYLNKGVADLLNQEIIEKVYDQTNVKRVGRSSN